MVWCSGKVKKHRENFTFTFTFTFTFRWARRRWTKSHGWQQSSIRHWL